MIYKNIIHSISLDQIIATRYVYRNSNKNLLKTMSTTNNVVRKPMFISKLKAAEIQLDAAIKHFFDDEHVTSLTLAGAAEDILAGLLQSSVEQCAFEFLHNWYQQTNNVTISKSDFSRSIANLGRNWLKHAQEDPETELEVTNLLSIQMLMRALPSYYILTKTHTPEMQRFFNYVNQNMKEIDKLFS